MRDVGYMNPEKQFSVAEGLDPESVVEVLRIVGVVW